LATPVDVINPFITKVKKFKTLKTWESQRQHKLKKLLRKIPQASATAGARDLGLHIKCWEIMTLGKIWHGHIYNLRPLQQCLGC